MKLVINSKYYLKIINLLCDAGAKARLVGGVVRDALVGLSSSDIDIVTNFTPEQVTEVLRANKIKVIPTGIRFGTVTALIKDEIFEITTLRKDTDCDGRHAKIAYTNSFKKDAARRDFTVNALSYCPFEEEIYDYFGGIEDLKAKKVVFIGDPDSRIKEDYLRILRFFRFSCRFSEKLDEKGLQACIKFKEKLKALSRERIKSEMDSILNNTNLHFMLEMFNSGILKEIFPIEEYDFDFNLKLTDALKKYKTCSVSVFYAALLKGWNDISEKKLLVLKFSKLEAMEIIKLQSFIGMEKEELIIALKKIWLEKNSVTDYFVFTSAMFDDYEFIYNLYTKLVNKKKPIIPINGNDLISLGFSGVRLGELISKLKIEWIKSEFTLTKNDLVKLVKDL